MEAVKLGSAAVGIKNKTHAVLVALKRASSELSAHQKKIIPIDKHLGMAITGLTADARMLRYNQNRLMDQQFPNNSLKTCSTDYFCCFQPLHAL